MVAFDCVFNDIKFRCNTVLIQLKVKIFMATQILYTILITTTVFKNSFMCTISL